MKKSLPIFLITFIALSLQAQTQQTYTQNFDSIFANVSRTDATTGILYDRVVPFATPYGFAQENKTKNNPHEVKKYAYQFIGEFCLVETGMVFETSNLYSDKHNVYSTLYRTGFILINNMVYKQKMSIGLGIGVDINPLGELGFPIFADFRYYFTEKNLQPFINIGVGAMPAIHYGFFSSSAIYEPG
jgi:hypothetical protein